ncbi:MAG: response regulator [Lachnospiraceae bacterium]|nr:response regulator [Lachnospiraceae bacterium]
MILLVSKTKNFIFSSIQSQLEQLHHEIVQVGYNLEEIKKYIDKMHLLLINGEQAEIDGVVYLKDAAIERNVPIFVIGDVNELAQVSGVVSEQYIVKKFLRPVNVRDIVECVDRFLGMDEVKFKKKILVVDDSGAMLRSVKSWLEGKYQVILANSGTMAIKYLAMDHPDLILLDYEMPVCDGRQVLEMIRSESEFASVPVFFLTGKNDRESVLSVSPLKPEGYLLKTMEPERIVQIIDEFFQKQKGSLL